MAEQFMQKATEDIKRRGTKGSLKRAAQRAGESTKAFAEGHKAAPGLTGKRSRLALAFMGANKS